MSIALLVLLAAPVPVQQRDAAPRPFLSAALCERCHDASARATALRAADGGDASPHGTWRGTMMANAFVDPYWRAKMAREVEAGGLEREEVEGLCLRCHAPGAHHGDRLLGRPERSFDQLRDDPAALDGVSCTVCHRVGPEGLGEPATFDGRPPFDPEPRLWGPYPDPAAMPMRHWTGYAATHGAHVQRSALCATCHTLTSEHAGGAFPEQSPYLEWRNSAFSDEDGAGEGSRTCQQCHMPDRGSMRIAHNPGGRDFPFLSERPGVRAHGFVGGNAYMLELMADHAEEFGLQAPPEALRATAAATRAQLAQDTARLAVTGLRHADGALCFELELENLTGHKLPTGYPGRRAWLEVVVTVDGARWFESGVADARGHLVEPARAFALPHRDLVRAADELQVYELVAFDAEGEPTALLTRMATRGKDNRLLPRGWRADGPHADATAPVGLGEDADFVGGGDRVRYELADAPAGAVSVHARLLYQSVPPHWVDELRASQAADAVRFVELYDARPATPEVLARASAELAR